MPQQISGRADDQWGERTRDISMANDQTADFEKLEKISISNPTRPGHRFGKTIISRCLSKYGTTRDLDHRWLENAAAANVKPACRR
jgi:hypothetical protein